MKRRQGKNIQTSLNRRFTWSKKGKTQNRQVSFAQYVSTFRVITNKTLHVENKLVNLRENYNTVNK